MRPSFWTIAAMVLLFGLNVGPNNGILNFPWVYSAKFASVV